jgi:hypothetical protein
MLRKLINPIVYPDVFGKEHSGKEHVPTFFSTRKFYPYFGYDGLVCFHEKTTSLSRMIISMDHLKWKK